MNKKILFLFSLLMANIAYSQCSDNILNWVQTRKDDPNRGGFGFNYGSDPYVLSDDDAGGTTIARGFFAAPYNGVNINTNKLEFDIAFDDYNDGVKTELWVNGVKYMDMEVPRDSDPTLYHIADYDDRTVYALATAFSGAVINGQSSVQIRESKRDAPAVSTGWVKNHIVLTFPTALTISSGSIEIRNYYPYLTGTPNARSQGDYRYYIKLAGCITDSDNDGIFDDIDLDDDNDGILDAEESPECFYNVFEAHRIASVQSPFNGSGANPSGGNTIPSLYDDNTNNGAAAFTFASGQAVTPGTPIFTIEYPTSVVLNSLTVVQSNYGMTSTTIYGKLYGSNDGINYTLLTVGNGLSLATGPRPFAIASPAPYRYYQVRYIGTTAAGNSSDGIIGTAAIHEITAVISTAVPYNASAHPKKGACHADADGDGIPNHLDLDSDGDGCSDAYEGGAATDKNMSVIPGPYGNNGLADSLETSLDNGIVQYNSTYHKYALLANQKLCLDTDHDGVPDPVDIDDDNDGVLDTDEGNFCGKLDRNIRVGYLNSGAGSSGLATNLLYNLKNFGIYGTFNKVRGVTLIPYNSAAAVTEATLLADNIDVFFVGSTAEDNNNATGTSSTNKVPTSVNTVLISWAKNHNKGIFAIQNNAVDYGYRTTSNNTNPNTPSGTIGKSVYTDGYWPTPTLMQSGSVQMTIMSSTRIFDILMTDANLRPVVVADREYNLVIFPDATIYNDNSGMNTPANNDQKAIADTWAYVFDKYLHTQCTFLDTDGDGIPNHLDLDSDGDGCSDALESGATASTTPDFSFVTQAGTSTDANSDGLADIVDANLNGIPDFLSLYDPNALDSTINQCKDSDGDGIVDSIDLDDDNDGILDTDEGLSCNSLNRNLRIGYLDTTLGKYGLMMNMLNNPVNFSDTGVYNKFPGITFVPYATQDAITEAQLLTDKIDVFYTGSSANETQTSTDKLLTATNKRIFSWAVNHDKGVIALQNNATDFGYILSNVSTNPSTPYGPTGEAVFTNGYWPVTTFNMSGSVQMTINSAERNYISIMADAAGKATFVRDREAKIVFIPDATIFIDNQSVAAIGTNATLKVAADVWAFAFDTFLQGKCFTQDTDGDGIPDHLDLDSDNDGCLDALEGDRNIANSQLVDAGGTLTVGAGSSALNKNLCADGTCVDQYGIPIIVGTAGQGIGTSQNTSVQSGCEGFCIKPGDFSMAGTPTRLGITKQNKLSNWPVNIPNGFVALESDTKGLVITRVQNSSMISDPKEGMIVYDIQDKCVKLYNGTVWKCIERSCND